MCVPKHYSGQIIGILQPKSVLKTHFKKNVLEYLCQRRFSLGKNAVRICYDSDNIMKYLWWPVYKLGFWWKVSYKPKAFQITGEIRLVMRVEGTTFQGASASELLKVYLIQRAGGQLFQPPTCSLSNLLPLTIMSSNSTRYVLPAEAWYVYIVFMMHKSMFWVYAIGNVSL